MVRQQARGLARRLAASYAAAFGWALVASTGHAAETTIYKSMAPDGSVTYSSQAPAPGAKDTTEIEVTTLSPEQRRAALLLRAHEKKANREVLDAAARDEQLRWSRADSEVRNATAALTRAETTLQTERIPRAGERLGNVGGGTRLTQAYFERLAKLEAGVNQAKARLDRAYEARGALK